MPLRFSRGLSLIAGLRVKPEQGAAPACLWAIAGPGRRLARWRAGTVGLPGSGLYWTERVPPTPACRWRLAAKIKRLSRRDKNASASSPKASLGANPGFPPPDGSPAPGPTVSQWSAPMELLIALAVLYVVPTAIGLQTGRRSQWRLID